jgi:hypothetical protein
MDRQIKSLLLSFSLGLTNKDEDYSVSQILASHPEYINYLLYIEQELQKKSNAYGIKPKNQSVLRRKLNKLGRTVL